MRRLFVRVRLGGDSRNGIDELNSLTLRFPTAAGSRLAVPVLGLNGLPKTNKMPTAGSKSSALSFGVNHEVRDEKKNDI